MLASPVLFALLLAAGLSAQSQVDYARDVEPLLRERCFGCHGPEKQRMNLRLDLAQTTLRGGRNGPALTPHRAEASLLVRRIEGRAGKRMPPDGPPLTEAQIAILRRWIDGGAVRPADPPTESAELVHWAYRPIRPVEPPRVDGYEHPVDRFLVATLRARGLEPARLASREARLRRLSLDLRGLPPTPDERRAFLADDRPGAWERAVDRFLADPACAEHRASQWLDLARYADTKGYEKDARRTMWPWRDWVIRAFEKDMPFDRFTKLQLAGDLMPPPKDAAARLDQLLATGFHRNTMTNDEGGTDNEEFRSAAVVDRVETTFEVWFGTTMSCARCHDHKYDPFSQREYFELYDFFNQTADRDRPDDAPKIRVPGSAVEARDLLAAEKRVEAAKTRLDAAARRADAAQDWPRVNALRALEAWAKNPPTSTDWEWSGPHRVAKTTPRRLVQGWAKVSFEQLVASTEGVRWRSGAKFVDGRVHPLRGPRAYWILRRRLELKRSRRVAFLLGSDDAFRFFVDGESVAGAYVERGAALDQDRVVLDLAAGSHEIGFVVVNNGGQGGFAFRMAPLGWSARDLAVLRKKAADRTPAEQGRLRVALRSEDAAWREAEAAWKAAEAERESIARRLPFVPILQELAAASRRETYVHQRGFFLNNGERVRAATPAVLHPFPEGAPRNRLGFAEWIVSKDNPLTARVVVNREWERLFGRGLVAVSEDWGTQGERPTHPRLLDWLAARFRENWSLRDLVRTIVTSAAYQRDSAFAANLADVDPENALLARGARVRLAAEAIRDSALAVAGLLSEKRGGPPVMPPQPDGVWTMVYSGDRWAESKGEDRYRRGLYTFWRRTAPYPSMTTFDAPSREFCVQRRIPTNTPLQSLVLLNDPVFVEAARALAKVVDTRHGPAVSAGLRELYVRALSREPAREEVRVLERYWKGECVDPDDEKRRRHAWYLVVAAIFSLEEFVTRG